MRNKKILTTMLALFLCASLVFPMQVFATEAGGDSQNEVQIEEQTKKDEITETLEKVGQDTEEGAAPQESEKESADTAETDVKPAIGEVTLKCGSKGYNEEGVQVSVTMGSGKYKASEIEFVADPIPGVEDIGVFCVENEGQYRMFSTIIMEDGASGKAGTYNVTAVFKNEEGNTVYEDTESVKVCIEEDWAKCRFPDIDASRVSWDGDSDVAWSFYPGTGMGTVMSTNETEQMRLLAKNAQGGTYKEYGLNDGEWEFDAANGKMIIKGSALKRIASEDETFGDAAYYETSCFFVAPVMLNDMFDIHWRLTYDRDALQQGMLPPKEVVLTKENPVIPADEMALLVEQNQKRDIVIRTGNGVDFTFLKGTMKLIDGKTAYDFGTTLITDSKESGIPGISADEFAFRINFNYSGQLPGKARISISLGGDSKWIQRELYYSLTESGKIIKLIDKNIVDANGVYTIEQDHCSDYVATTRDMTAKSVIGRSPKTGDASMVWLLVGVMLISGVIVLRFWRVKANWR